MCVLGFRLPSRQKDLIYCARQDPLCQGGKSLNPSLRRGKERRGGGRNRKRREERKSADTTPKEGQWKHGVGKSPSRLSGCFCQPHSPFRAPTLGTRWERASYARHASHRVPKVGELSCLNCSLKESHRRTLTQINQSRLAGR